MGQYIKVHAKPGTRLTRPGSSIEFIGFRRTKSGEPCDFSVRGGFSYSLNPEGEVVRNTRRIRQAIRKGDLLEAPQQAEAHVGRSEVMQEMKDAAEAAQSAGKKSAAKGVK